jgi:hypothetical protein
MTIEEFHVKHDQMAIYSQDACNASGLLTDALKVLMEWRQIEGVNMGGKDCPHLKFLLYQIVFLVFGREPFEVFTFDEYHDAMAEIKGRIEARKIEKVREAA